MILSGVFVSVFRVDTNRSIACRAAGLPADAVWKMS